MQKFMQEARNIASQSGCIRGESRFGAVAVRDDVVIASGWNGPIGKIPPCVQSGKCIRQVMKIPSGTRRETSHCICAEQHLICNAARDGVKLLGATMYVTGLPCKMCVKLIVAAGLKRVVYEAVYTQNDSYKMAELAGLELVQFS